MPSALDLCNLAWSDQDGYVFLSVRDPEKESGDSGYWRDLSFKWPEEKDRVSKILDKAITSKNDVYWAPAVFEGPKRDKNTAMKLDSLWADLDECNPKTLPEDYPPAAVWQTSPGRWQALWKLPEPIDAKVQQELNRNLTYLVGADKGGWDLTQVLRIPGTRNHKYEDMVSVELQKLNGACLTSPSMFRLLSNRDDRVENREEDWSTLPDPKSVLKKYKLKARAKHLLSARSVPVGHRSETLWELECLLAEAGMSAKEVMVVARRSAWNKFSGRHDEMTRLMSEANKAVSHVAKSIRDVTAEENSKSVTAEEKSPRSVTAEEESTGGVTTEDEVVEEVGPLVWNDFDKDHKPIRWLVADIWGESEVGFISGLPKSYKSWLALDLAVSVATGTRFLGSFQSKKTNVLLVQEEDPRPVLQDRLVRIAAAKDLVWAKQHPNNFVEIRYELPESLYVISNQGFTITNEDSFEELEEWVVQLDIGLVILDPLMMMAEGVDEFKAFDMMSKVFKPLKRLRARTQASVCIVHHHLKGSAGSSSPGAAAMYGSVALWAWEESALHLSLPGPGKVTAERFSKHSNLAPITVEMGDTDIRWDPEVHTGVASTDLLDLIAMYENGITIDEVITSTGLTKDVALRQIKRLENSGKLERAEGIAQPGKRGRRPAVWRVK